MINPFHYNPALAGTEDYADIRTGHRKQWAGFEGSPRSVFLSGHTNIGKTKVVNSRVRSNKKSFHGVGGVISNDKVGPTQLTTVRAAYANHLKLSKKVFASLGVMEARSICFK
jgi:type IX secretion system PorP/SprF family membrane protein